MVEAVPTTPLAALLFQWYKQTPNMLDIGLAPVVGATVVTKKAWNPIPAADRPKLMAAAAGVQQRLQDEVPKLDAASIAEMKKRGLVVTKAAGPEWRAEVDKLAATMRGQMVPKDIYDLALKARDAYRKQEPAQASRSGQVIPSPHAARRRHRRAGACRDGRPSARRNHRRAKLFGVGIPGSGPFVQHLTLWIGFLGAAIAAREGKLLALATGTFIPGDARVMSRRRVRVGRRGGMATILAWGGVQLVLSERESGSIIAADVPVWVGQLALPIGFTLIALRLAWKAGRLGGRVLGVLGIAVGLALDPRSRDSRVCGRLGRAARRRSSPRCSARRSSRFSAARRCCSS